MSGYVIFSSAMVGVSSPVCFMGSVGQRQARLLRVGLYTAQSSSNTTRTYELVVRQTQLLAKEVAVCSWQFRIDFTATTRIRSGHV